MAGDPGKRISAAEKRAFDRGNHPTQLAATLRPLTPPKTLSIASLAIWKEVVASQPPSTYSAADRYQMVVYCDAVVEYDVAQAHLAGPDGYQDAGSKGQPVASIWVGVRDRARQTIDKVGATLYLTPASRNAIRSQEAVPTQVSEFGSLIQ